MLAQQKQDEDNGDEFVVWNVDGMYVNVGLL